MMGVAAMSAMMMAQNVTTHSVYDVNQNGEIDVADALSVSQAALHELAPGQTQQYVTADDLSQLLQSIQNDLALIKEKLGITNDGGEPEDDNSTAVPAYPVTGLNNGYGYVDLGVVVGGKPLYWATTNIGADSPADYGMYFAWGETIGYQMPYYHKFDWTNYSSKLCGGASDKMRKYCNSRSAGTVDNKTVLDPEDDAACVNWQSSWRMPTMEEQEALCEQCNWTWTTMTNSAGDSINGWQVSNKTDSSKYIFLPVAGYRHDVDFTGSGTYGYYWSSSIFSINSTNAYYLDLTPNVYDWNFLLRCFGMSIRAVCQ